MTPRLEAIAVAKRWPDGSGLRPTSFTAMPGDVVVVRGRSGSGKSTLLGVIAALCAPDEGAILLDGVEVPLSPPSWSVMTLVPQTFALAVELTVRENVDDAGRGVTSADVTALLAALDLHKVAAAVPDAVSMGEQQRCAVARALVTAPRVLLADEPTSHQDAGHAAAVLRCLRDAAGRGTTVVIASHDPAVSHLATVVVDLEHHT
jgi:ABC-type lipoprotein export system ATPase subunit